MLDRRAQLGVLAIATVVFLRLVIGWHFFTEGVGKFGYDPAKGRYALTFSAESFFYQATGPLAGWFHSQAPTGHDWRTLLAVAHRDGVAASADEAEQQRRLAEHERRLKEVTERNEPEPIDLPDSAPYYDWARKILDDWREMLRQATAIDGITDEQRQAMADAFAMRQEQLAEYLEDQSEAIADYRHELWRLENWRAMPEADGLPFHERRITRKAAETADQPARWVRQVEELGVGYRNDLREVLTSEQRADAKTAVAMDRALTRPAESWLRLVNVSVTALTLGVGILLLLGLFTRLAAVIGAIFLLAVIATQPPWVPEAAPTINQWVELAGLLAVAGTGAGRWLGLDYFLHAWWPGCCGKAG